jgi:hypothetical protein
MAMVGAPNAGDDRVIISCSRQSASHSLCLEGRPADVAVQVSVLPPRRPEAEWSGVGVNEKALAAVAGQVVRHSIGRPRARPRAQQLAVQALIEPILLACGYACEPLPPGAADTYRAFAQRLRRGIKRRRARATAA